MSRLTIEVTPEQHQQIKAIAAMRGQSIKDYVQSKLLEDNLQEDEAAAWEQLRVLLSKRIQQSSLSKQTIQSITQKVLENKA